MPNTDQETLPGICYPIDSVTVNTEQLDRDLTVLMQRLAQPLARFRTEAEHTGFSALNLTHPPQYQGQDRWLRHREDHRSLERQGIDEGTFTELLEEVRDLYMGQLIQEIRDYHRAWTGSQLQGRCQLVWIWPGRCYALHRDLHTPYRYHVPLKTDPLCWFLFERDRELHRLHMPVGQVWFLDPVTYAHTVVYAALPKLSPPRLHMILTTRAQ